MKNITVLLASIFLLSCFEGNSQVLKVNSSGRLDIDGKNGSFGSSAPRISINSNGTTFDAINTGLNLFNTNTTINNWIKLNYSTKLTDNSETDVISLATQYKDRTPSTLSGDFHIITSNRGTYNTRFAILSTTDANHVKFHFNTGYASNGNGIFIDNSKGGPTFYTSTTNYGYLGTENNYWYKLYVTYPYFRNQPSITSDGRKKKDIRNIETGVMSKINKVRPVKYKLTEQQLTVSKDKTTKSSTLEESTPSSETENLSLVENSRPLFDQENLLKDKEKSDKIKQRDNEKEQYGFIAQELKEVFPDIVTYDSINDEYGVMYTALIPIIIEALKEQQLLITEQSNEISELKQIVNNCCSKNNKKSEVILEEKATKLSTTEVEVLSTEAKLYQNTPNPFTSKTEIRYTLSKNATSAKINIYDLQGQEVMSFVVNPQQEEGVITIQGSKLNAGIYLYGLLVDNQLIDTKKMVLTK